MQRKVIRSTAMMAATLAISTLAYQWGNWDGRAGRTLQLIETADAAEKRPEFSPVKARARDFYPPEAFGKIMSIIKPRMAIAYHFFKDFDTTSSIHDGIRSTYDGPLSLSEDYMVWNITKDDIRVRMARIDDDVWPPPATEKPQLPDPNERVPYSEMIDGGRYDVKDVIQPVYDRTNKQYGINEKQE